eukprot:5759281-Pyramimonas_sp.AAC.1
MPRVEGDIAASPPTQPPTKPGGKDTAGSQHWKPSTREPPPALTKFIGTNFPRLRLSTRAIRVLRLSINLHLERPGAGGTLSMPKAVLQEINPKKRRT